MTTTLKGFITNTLYIDNAVGVVAPFGELSPRSSTFSLEKGYYVSTAATNLTLVSFLSQTNGVNAPLTAGLRDTTLGICSWIYAQTNAANGEIYADTFLTAILAAQVSVASTFACGSIIESVLSTGTFYIPEWVSWVDTATGAVIKLWFVDASFQSQYDEYTIIVVPPIPSLNSFFGTAVQVQALLNAQTVPVQYAAIQTAKNNLPETILTAETFSYIDPLDSTNTIETNWTCLIYGPAGNNVDAISDALIAYILANSTYTQTQWTTILPDIFLRTEYMMIPLFDQYAIPNRTVEDGIYSGQVNLARVTALVITLLTDYAASHINTYLNVLPNPYKSLQIAVIGSANNRNAQYELIDVFPDIINVASTSGDFNRMSQTTQVFLENLATMLITAETMTQYSDIPSGFTSVIRDGNLWIVFNYNNIHYMVLAKEALTTVITGVIPTT